MRRCKECGAWNAMKVISYEELNRMELAQKSSKRKVYQVRYKVTKRCKHCAAERDRDIIRKVKEK